MNGTNRPLVKPKRRLVSFTTCNDDDDGLHILCNASVQDKWHQSASRQTQEGFTTQNHDGDNAEVGLR